MRTSFKVKNVSCGACVSDINSKLLQVNGVYGVFANIATQSLDIEHTDDTDLDKIDEILKESNYKK
ncbi:heavy-metal-associated domain-containing protein [Halosquirtibacter xylanolyticus]|uniref:heavy-metal-associated domain-containing protein n=1 Tax=Halosquirtibacter xylanolyticus TaxID=3374599 RepID=UPI0037485D6C|nr:heavy-metal-associated domain-containing protein [Prolixibacteraceae bacterium]